MNLELPKSGDVLAGKYEIEHVVGEGGMCVVYAAMHLQLQQRVAIKMLRPGVAHRPEAVERFMREGRAAIRIRSEYCVRILDVDVLEGGEPYIVMEHLDGSDLEALIVSNGPSAVTPAVDYILQAGEAIAEAHTLGIIHRDLKPANLFFARRADGTPWIKVLDFGISKVPRHLAGDRETRLTGDAAVMGSPQYMSPEQLRATRNVDHRADIWALGTILHELLSGEPPFNGDTVTAVCLSIVQDLPPRLSKTRDDVPAGLDAAVQRCLEKDPEERFASMAEVAVALSEFASPAGRASVQRIVGTLQSASEGPRDAVVVQANEKTAWGSTGPLWHTSTRKRGSVAGRIVKVTASVAVLAAAAFAGVSYAGAKGVALPVSVTAAVARVTTLFAEPTPPATPPPSASPPPAPVARAPETLTAPPVLAPPIAKAPQPSPPSALPTWTPTAIAPNPQRPTPRVAAPAPQAAVPSTPPDLAPDPVPVPVPLPVPLPVPAAAPPPPAEDPPAPPASPALLFDERK